MEGTSGEASHRLVIGSGGTGRSHRLRTWVAGIDDGEPSRDVVWLTGRPQGAPDETAVRAAIDEASSSGRILVIDDLQWFGEDGLGRLVAAAGEVAMWASRRPWPTSANLRALNDLLTEHRGADRVGLLDADTFASTVPSMVGSATATDAIDRWFRATAGSIGLAADVVATGWSGADDDPVPEELIDAVAGRIERAGPEASELVSLLAVTDGIEIGLVAEAMQDSGRASAAQRAARAGGLLDAESELIPLVRAAVVRDLPSADRVVLHDRLAVALGPRHPDLALTHIVEGSGSGPEAADAMARAASELASTEPERAIELIEQGTTLGIDSSRFALSRARAAVVMGDGEALAHIDAIPAEVRAEAADDGVAVLSVAVDLRDLRLDDASARPTASALGDSLRALARSMVGTPQPMAPDPALGPQIAMVARTLDGLHATATGLPSPALAAFTAASDDHDRLGADSPLGITPHFVGALSSMLLGDLSAAESLLTQAIERESGGRGEEAGQRLLLALVRLVNGQFHDALAAVRDGDNEAWPQRDRLLLAVLDAALARRSGDTARLREAWRRADPVLARQTTGWILLDPLTEIIAAGARIGDSRRIDPVVERLVRDAAALPADGPGPTAAHWLSLQVSLARDDTAGTQAAAARLAECVPVDRRSQLRIEAGQLWAALVERDVDVDRLTACTDQLVDVGDSWEASRLLGQAALDHEDPKVARRLLEAARALMSEISDHDENDGLVALGLSEREVEVAKLVAEGRTHKEAGAQLFISPKTVEHHVARIRQKLGATSRAELLAIIRENTG